ncbi:hypothetical protein CFC21_010149 [Triticum aestivum]|uniref:DUF4220 domain-containing protein n=2 Tax=Triticum aestivum TaxID=4565 RepID=A0A9R1IU89_WHEAT|nr:hypothetical protein CFC21_010149 [Triticum aestivum]
MGGVWLDQEKVEQINLWLTRVLVLLSFIAHLVLALLSDIRRRNASGPRRLLLWVAYQVTEKAPTAALGKLFLDSASSEQRLFAFWVPFLLLHLGRPDNITAYTLEDNMLSWRLVLDVFVDLGGALYGAYKHRFMADDWNLCAAFSIMYFLGCYKYWERAVALRQGTFSRIRSSNEKKPLMSFTADQPGRQKLDDEDALFDAHRLLGIAMGAFAYYPVKRDPRARDNGPLVSYYHWEDVCKVVEMELSLMYDIMYTKATVVHTWRGYLIRIASPPLTATALLLFLFHSKEGQKEWDIIITYILLIGTLLLDVRWLLRALGSAWTHSFFRDTTWLNQTVCCRRGTWYRLRRFVASLDPSWRFGHVKDSNSSSGHVKEPSSYRMWSGTTGQLNLFHTCTQGPANLWRTLMKKMTLEDSSKGLGDQDDIKKSSLQDISEALLSGWAPPLNMVEAFYEKPPMFDQAMRFGPHFHQLVLTWHVATDIYLLCSKGETPAREEKGKHLKSKIKYLSDYMMFLLLERPDMLPDLKIRTQYEQIRHELENIWSKRNIHNSSFSGDEAREKLALTILDVGDDIQNGILQDAVKYAHLLLNKMASAGTWKEICKDLALKEEDEKKLILLIPEFEEYLQPRMGSPRRFPENDIVSKRYIDVLKLIQESWLRVLIFASIRCSRDTHAKQLSLGGELTTIVWMLYEHRDMVDSR